MNYLDHEEQQIKDLLNSLSVDSEHFKEKMKKRLADEPMQINAYRYRRKRSFAALLALFLVLGSTAIAAKFGTFGWLMETFHPSYQAVTEPVEVFSEDNGIRLEIIGAQKYQNTAVVYLSISDTTGQKRLTEKSDFSDTFQVATVTGKEKSSQSESNLSSFTLSKKLLFFDTESNTLYYEFYINADGDSPLADHLQIGAKIINFDYKEHSGEIALNTLNLIENNPISLKPEHILSSGWSKEETKRSPLALSFHNPVPLHEKQKDVKLCNIGMIDDKLHLQIKYPFYEEFGSQYHTFYLVDEKGNKIDDEGHFSFLTDESGNVVTLSEVNVHDKGNYRHNEYFFSVDPARLSGYKLLYSFDVVTGTEGNWKVAANLSDSKNQIKTVTTTTKIDSHTFTNFIITPLGVESYGNYEGEFTTTPEMQLSLETASGLLPTLTGSGSWQNQKFYHHWRVDNPINVDEIIAIHINGQRIEVK